MAGVRYLTISEAEGVKMQVEEQAMVNGEELRDLRLMLYEKDEQMKRMQAEIAELRKDAEEFRDLMKSLKMSVNGRVEILRKDCEE